MGNDLIITVGSRLLISQTENLISNLSFDSIQALLVYLIQSSILRLGDLLEKLEPCMTSFSWDFCLYLRISQADHEAKKSLQLL